MYEAIFMEALNRLAPTETIWIEDLLQVPGLPPTSMQTRKKYLKQLVNANPSLLERIDGLYPSADTVINLIEDQHGLVLESNLDVSNQRAAAIVRRIGRPTFDRFVGSSLQAHITGQNISLTKIELMDFLLDEFADFMRGAGNGLVSIAGTLNEQLLIRALINGGLQQGQHFTKTGTNSQADLIIHSSSRAQPNLGVEIKSYHARERLLRGLQDITGAKIGIGFFKDAQEFNGARTTTLLQTQAAAIYMPQLTLNNVDPAARSRVVNVVGAVGSRLYRPIEQFVSDMAYFNINGVLPSY